LLDLINLDPKTGGFAAAQYPLRPSAFTVATYPERMRARGFTWLAWLRDEGLPVPWWVASSIPIEGKPLEPNNLQPALPAPTMQSATNGQRRKPSDPDAAY